MSSSQTSSPQEWKQLDDPQHYTIGWIAALPKERAAAIASLNDRHQEPKGFVQNASDTNSYTWGRIGKHNIVIASLAAGVYGISSATVTASSLVSSLPHIRIGLLVGVGGGIARPHRGGPDIRLGDVVVSQPSGTVGGVIQYDLGKAKANRVWERKGSLNRPPSVLLNALSALQAEHEVSPPKLPGILKAMLEKNPYMKGKNYAYQGHENDCLFETDYNHVGGTNCDLCDKSRQVMRMPRTDPKIHYGIIASGNTLVKDAVSRDEIWNDAGADCLCVEMEAAGLMNEFPCLVIRGICDYADSHKNDRWHQYASATAAAFAVELLGYVPVAQLQATQHLSVVFKAFNEDIAKVRSTTFEINGKVNTIQTRLTSTERRLMFGHLPIAAGASFNSHANEHNPTCLEGTRVKLLEEIRDWVKIASAYTMCWLSGMAGTGKSTISQTLAVEFARSGHLGASFFFKRGEADRGNSSKLFTTIAAELVENIPELQPFVEEVVNNNPNIADKAAEDQFDKLIMQPVKSITVDRVHVIIIDALDECDGEEDVKGIIRLFSELNCLNSKKLKVFITSRPELHIRFGLSHIKNLYESHNLHEVENKIVKQDIKIYLEYELEKIREKHDLKTWPSEDDISALVQMASPLFIVASTIRGFLGNDQLNPKEMLSDVMEHRTGGLGNLNAMYRLVLNQLIKGLEERHKGKIIQNFRNIVGSIIILAEPLSFLHSVLNIPSSNTGPVRLLHLSFREYLLDPRSTQNEFHVDENQAHHKVATDCLRLLNGDALKEDICQLSWPGTDRSSVDRNHIELSIPPELQYACLYWTYHIKEANMDLNDQGPVLKFLSRHFLHWLEAMSLMGRAPESLSIIRSLHSVCKASYNQASGWREATTKARPGSCTQIEDFVQDAERFILANMTTINETPLQIYSSVLAFTPEKSLIRRIFFTDSQIPKWMPVSPKPDEDWDPCQQILEGLGDYQTTLAFSHDLKLFAIPSHETIELWRVEDNQCIKKLSNKFGSRKDGILTLIFSHDSKLLASGSSDNVIRIWNVENGQKIFTLTGHQDHVLSLAFSHDSKLLASGSKDTTIRLWNIVSGKCNQVLKGHKLRVQSVAFSHNSQLLASTALREPARIWRVNEGRCIQTLDVVSAIEDHRYVYNKFIAFSHDSKLLVLTFNDRLIQIWREHVGKYIQNTKIDISLAGSMAFSRNSHLLAATTPHQRAIKLWDARSGQLVQELNGHTGLVYCVAFSHDSKYLASGSTDDTVRIWRINDDAADGGQIKKQRMSQQMILSHDSKFLATASYSNSPRIQLWRLADGQCIQEINLYDPVHQCSFLGRSKFLALLFGDNSIRFWRETNGGFREDPSLNMKVPLHSKSYIKFSSDQELFALISPYTIRVLRVDTGKCIRELELRKAGTCVQFSHDWTLIAYTTPQNTIQIWSVKEGRCIQEVKGAQTYINSMVFSHDSKILASYSLEEARIWRLNDGQCIGQFPSEMVCSKAFSRDSKLLVSSWLFPNHGTIRLWDVENNVLKREIRRIRTDLLEFTPDNLFLHTRAGKLLVTNGSAPIPYTKCLLGIGVNADRSWITWQQRKLLWLPKSVRPIPYDGSLVSGSTVILASEYGKVIAMKFDEQELLNIEIKAGWPISWRKYNFMSTQFDTIATSCDSDHLYDLFEPRIYRSLGGRC